MRTRFALLSFVVLAACGKDPEQLPVPESATAVRDAVKPAILDRAQLASLRWLEGSWRGTGDDTPPFFERYTFPNDSTMISATFTDSTRQVVNDSSVYQLRDGQFGSTQYVVTAIGGDSIAFAPIGTATNSFVWKRVSADEWMAVLAFPSSSGTGVTTRTYTLRRVR